MRGKKPRPKSKAKTGPADVAQAAGCSKQLASRLLKRGMTEAEIIERIRENKARKAELDLPTTPVRLNGHAAEIPTFSESQRRKEAALATIREHEAGLKIGALVEAEQTRRWLAHIFVPLVNGVRGIPDEMRDLLTPEVAELLRRRIEGCIASADRYLVACHERAGQQLSDGALEAGNGYRIEWKIISPPVTPPPEEPEAA
jgi:hypothetical protein